MISDWRDGRYEVRLNDNTHHCVNYTEKENIFWEICKDSGNTWGQKAMPAHESMQIQLYYKN